MAILRVSPELLLEALFRNCCPLTTIEGAGFDAARNLILLDIRGPKFLPLQKLKQSAA